MKKGKQISFVTPYLSGTTWLEFHLESIRKYHPGSEIIISAPDNSAREIVRKYKGRYFDNNSEYWQAVEFLFGAASHDTVILCDCDTILLNNVDYLADKLAEFDFVGIEERIRHPANGHWFRYAPGFVDWNFFLFSQTNNRKKIPSWPKFPPFTPRPENQNNEDHYATCQLLPKHYYLRPYTTAKYGLGNLIKDGNKPIVWHQWFGSWGKRAKFISDRDTEENPYKNLDELKAAEQRFFRDYPNLDLSGLKPAY